MNKTLGFLTLLWSANLMASSGIYVGGALGYGVINLNPQIEFTINPPGIMAELDQHLTMTGFEAAPILGVVGQWDRFRLETELQAFWTSVEERVVDDGGGSWILFDFQHEYVWLLRPGFQLYKEVPLFLYANAGVAQIALSAKASMDSIQAANTGIKQLWGYKVGGGLGYVIQDHWELRVDYLYSGYEKIKNEAPQNFGLPDLIPVSLELETSESQYLVGLTYKW